MERITIYVEHPRAVDGNKDAVEEAHGIRGRSNTT